MLNYLCVSRVSDRGCAGLDLAYRSHLEYIWFVKTQGGIGRLSCGKAIFVLPGSSILVMKCASSWPFDYDSGCGDRASDGLKCRKTEFRQV